MNKHGSALILGLLLILVLSALSASFYSKSINENILVNRQAESSRALWLAEAGLATAVDRLPSTASENNKTLSDNNQNYVYSTTITHAYHDAVDGHDVYRITSTGTVTLRTITLAGQPEKISRNIEAYVKSGDLPASSFQYAIETTTDLVVKGAVEIHPADSWKEYSTLDFQALFGYSKTDLKNLATHLYTPATFGPPIDGVTWVDVPAGAELQVTGNYTGSGILIVSGDAHFAGTVDFNGIIYVIGKLRMSGTFQGHGSVLAESSTTVDTKLTGTVDLYYDQAQIDAALSTIRLFTRDIVSWREF